MSNYYYPAILLKKMRIFALEFILIAIAMNNVSFPKITTTVQAETCIYENGVWRCL